MSSVGSGPPARRWRERQPGGPLLKVVVGAVVLGGLAVAMVEPAAAQGDPSVEAADEVIAEPCSGPEHRQFDFWLGSWEVTDTVGRLAGTNEITRVANGCALLESWRGARGPTGTSLNFYDPGTGRWHQVWAGLGLYLRLSGGLEAGKMVLSGVRETEEGQVVDRITWTPLDDGSVRQVWDVSRDGGGTWQTAFDGLYTRR